MSISVCIPTWNRFEMTIGSFEQVLDDNRVSEIVISDDCSTDGNYEKLLDYFTHEPKVKVFQNDNNQDCYRNKKTAIELAANKWCCLWDSDNIFDQNYLDRIFDYAWDAKTLFTPSFAYPNFNFEDYSGLTISKENVSAYMDLPLFETMLNAANFFVNRQEYLDVWEGDIDPVTSDSIYFAYKWLQSGRKIFVVPNLSYFHRVHNGSHYQNNISRTPNGFHQSIINQLKVLR